MRAAHILRKYDPSEWGGTETAVLRLYEGLKANGVTCTIYCPELKKAQTSDPFRDRQADLRRYRAFIPVWGISAEKREQLIRLGGNIMSIDLARQLLREPGIEVIHSHALNRIAGIGYQVARRRRIPFVVTIHGGALDLPAATRAELMKPLEGGVEWGKVFGAILRSRQVLAKADAVLTCNQREADLMTAQYPHQRVIVQPHSVPVALYRDDRKAAAERAFPSIRGREALLIVARIDPVKNQGWVVEQMAEIIRRHPQALLVLAGASTNDGYEQDLRKAIRESGLENAVLMTGSVSPGSPELVGLIQSARVLLNPSISETFGLTILEAYAAGTPVIASRTGGSLSLVKDGESGWLFDLDQPAVFHRAIDEILSRPEPPAALVAAGRKLADEYDVVQLAGRVKALYEKLIEEKRRA